MSMNTLIKLTGMSNKPIYFNPLYVSTIQPDVDGLTRVYVTGMSTPFLVAESVETVIQLVQDSDIYN